MPKYDFTKNIISVGGAPIESFADVENPVEFLEDRSILPVFDIQGIDGYIAVGYNKRNIGTLVIRLSQESKSNAVLSAFLALPVIDQINKPILIKPDGREDFYYFANGIIMGRPDYRLGQEVGMNEWRIRCIGVNGALLGGLF